MRPRATLLLLFLLFPCSVFAWGDLGHRAISEAVQANLTPDTVKAISSIVGSGDELPSGTLAGLSLWPDQIRAFNKNANAVISGFSLGDLHEGRTFAKDHPDNAEWHYADLPPGSAHYPIIGEGDPHDPVLPFTRSHDIVHMIHSCIKILETESVTGVHQTPGTPMATPSGGGHASALACRFGILSHGSLILITRR